MGQAVPVRTDYTAGEVRRFARRAKDGAQARRLLALAAVLDGASREEAAKIGGMDRQTLRDWVIRYNEQGPDGLINIPSPGAPPSTTSSTIAATPGTRSSTSPGKSCPSLAVIGQSPVTCCEDWYYCVTNFGVRSERRSMGNVRASWQERPPISVASLQSSSERGVQAATADPLGW